MSIQEISSFAGHFETNNGLKGMGAGPDSVNGYDLRIGYKYDSGKPIKYLIFVCVPYNAVGDIVECSATGRTEARLQLTGPIQPGKKRKLADFEDVWYSSTLKSVEIKSIEICYMDGTEEILNKSQFEQKSNDMKLALGLQVTGGCYVATAVYGSYNCPEVWTLRRYRDFRLAETWYGRAFIHMYYAISPTLVKWFGDTQWFKNLWRTKLDRMVERLISEGFSNEPYDDRQW